MIDARLSVFQGVGQPFAFVAHPVGAAPGPGECLVQISLASVCGSDLHTVDGRRNGPTPVVLGHEGVGRVLAVGSGRETGLVGRRVTWTLADSCGVCRCCREWDLPQKCERLFKYGHAPFQDGTGLNGTYASHVLLRAGTTVRPLPVTVTDEMAVSANCALATMVGAVEGLGGPGELAVIQGAGLLGLYGCALLKELGWRRVVVVDTNPARLELVDDFGGEPALNSACSVVPSGTADAVFEVTGQGAVIAEGLDLLRPRGRYQWVGMVHAASRFELVGEVVVRKCLTIQGLHNYVPRHLGAAVEFLQRQGARLPWERLISPALPLESLDAAMALARTGRWARVAVRP